MYQRPARIKITMRMNAATRSLAEAILGNAIQAIEMRYSAIHDGLSMSQAGKGLLVVF
jgi:hypothetical protein